MIKPQVFMGSSAESAELAKEVKRSLGNKYRAKIWYEDFFEASDITLAKLLDKADSYDLAIFIFAPDDKLNLRGRELWATRDNVVFEYGLFLASLGQHQCFIFRPDGDECRVPTDLNGLTTINYLWTRSCKASSSGKKESVFEFTLDGCMEKLRRDIKAKTGPLSGRWIQNWEVSSTNYPLQNPSDASVLHFGDRFRAEFRSKRRQYEAIGNVAGHFISGIWRDKKHPENYHGTFQLKIQASLDTLSGKWIGYSSVEGVKAGTWEWSRNA